MDRVVLVVGTQCCSEQVIDDLAIVTRDLHDVLRDPQLGGCTPALRDGRSLLLGSREEPLLSAVIYDAIRDAYLHAGELGTTLVLALVGHGFATPDASELFFMGTDAELDDPDTAVSVTTLLRHATNRRGVDGVIAIADMCAAGAAPPDSSALTAWSRRGGTRLTVMAAAAPDENAYDLRFSRELTNVLRTGIPGKGAYLDAVKIKPEVQRAVPGQSLHIFVHDGVSWTPGPDESLWISQNRAMPDSWNGSLDVEWVDYLTSRYRHISSRSHIAAALEDDQVIGLVGPAGSGKSVQLATFADERLAGTNGAHAAWFCDRGNVVPAIAKGLGQQMSHRLPADVSVDFTARAQRARARAKADERGVDSWAVEFGDPLVGALAAAPGTVVTIVLDGVDQLAPLVRKRLGEQVVGLLDATRGSLRVLFSAQDENSSSVFGPVGERARILRPSRLDRETFSGWLADQGVASSLRGCLLDRHSENWLLSRLLLDLALDGLSCDDLPDSLASAYQLIVQRAGRRPDPNGALVTLLCIIAANADMAMPTRVVGSALAAAGRPVILPELRDLLSPLRHVIARLHPGTFQEVIRPVHSTFVDWLRGSLDPADMLEAHRYILRGLEDLGAAARADHEFDVDQVVRTYRIQSSPSLVVGAELWDALPDAVDALIADQRPYLVDQRDEWSRRLESITPSSRAEPAILAIRVRLANLTGQLDDPEWACAEFRRIVNHYRDLRGPEHPDTLDAVRGYAHWLGRSGKPSEARDVYRAVERDIGSRLAPSDPQLLRVRGAIAYWTGIVGDLDTAIRLLSDLVPEMTAALGVDSDLVRATRNDLADFAGKTGDNSRALRQFEALEADTRRTLGPNDPRTLTARFQVARWTGRSGEPARAAELLRSLDSDQLRINGPHHLSTFGTRREMGDWLARSNQYLEALEILRDLLVVQAEVLCVDHPYRLKAQASVAECIGRAGWPDRARDLYEQVLAGQQRRYGADNPLCFRTRLSAAGWDAKAGNIEGAIRTLDRLRTEARSVLGRKHWLVANIDRVRGRLRSRGSDEAPLRSGQPRRAASGT